MTDWSDMKSVMRVKRTGNREFAAGIGAERPSRKFLRIIGLCLIAFAVPCVADEAREVESGKRKAVDGALMAEDGAPNTEHRTPNAEGGSLNPEPRTLNPVPPAPMTEEEYKAELGKIQDMLRDRRITLWKAESALRLWQRELTIDVPACSKLHNEIQELRSLIADKDRDLQAIFEQDKEFVKLTREVEEKKKAIQNAREKLSDLVEKRREERSTSNVPTSDADAERPTPNDGESGL